MQNNKILFLGHSNIVRRRVLPALESLSSFKGFEVASHNSKPEVADSFQKHTASYGTYEQALSESDCGIVYVSTINSEHEKWVNAALESGRHVIVDKPACLSLESAEKLSTFAKSRQLLLAEATVYEYHPQIELVQKLFADSELTRIHASFSVPPFMPDNFRNNPELGGGALLDLGPYAVSIGRIFYGEEPEHTHIEVGDRLENGLISSFSILFKYTGSKSLVGHFGFTTQYINHIDLFGPDKLVSLDRIFTITPDLKNQIQVASGMERSTETASAADPFSGFLTQVYEFINKSQFEKLENNLLADARTLERIRKQAGEI